MNDDSLIHPGNPLHPCSTCNGSDRGSLHFMPCPSYTVPEAIAEVERQLKNLEKCPYPDIIAEGKPELEARLNSLREIGA